MKKDFLEKIEVCKKFLEDKNSRKFFTKWQNRIERYRYSKKTDEFNEFTDNYNAAHAVMQHLTEYKNEYYEFFPCRPQKLAFLMVNTLAKTPQEALERIFSALLFTPRGENLEELQKVVRLTIFWYVRAPQSKRDARPHFLLREFREVFNDIDEKNGISPDDILNTKEPIDSLFYTPDDRTRRFFKTAVRLFAGGKMKKGFKRVLAHERRIQKLVEFDEREAAEIRRINAEKIETRARAFKVCFLKNRIRDRLSRAPRECRIKALLTEEFFQKIDDLNEANDFIRWIEYEVDEITKRLNELTAQKAQTETAARNLQREVDEMAAKFKIA